jgi:hypothetical protein
MRFALVTDLDWTLVSTAVLKMGHLLLAARDYHNISYCIQSLSSPIAIAWPPDLVQIDHNEADHEHLLAFNRLWTTHFASNSLLIYSTGRSPELYHKLAVSMVLHPE